MKYSVIIILFLCITLCLYFLRHIKRNSLQTQSFSDFHTVLAVKNLEDSIEGTIRSLVKQMHTTSNKASMPKNIIALDLNSDDQTLLILQKLSVEYPFVQPMNINEYTEYIKLISLMPSPK